MTVLIRPSICVFCRCQWYFKAKMTSEEKRRSSYQNGHGKSASLLLTCQISKMASRKRAISGEFVQNLTYIHNCGAFADGQGTGIHCSH